MKLQKSYERKPLSAGASRLWSEYQREEQERQNKRERLRQERMGQREEAVKDFRLRNLLIKNMTSGILNKLILYRLSRNRLKKQLQKKQWIDWLRAKAVQSHPAGKHSLREKQGAASSKRISEEALAYLQSRYEGHSSYLWGIERHPLEPETITRKGTRIFAEGVKENGGRLFVSRHATEAQLKLVMDFADRHYKDVTAHASELLRARMKAVSAAQHPTERKQAQERLQDEGYER